MEVSEGSRLASLRPLRVWVFLLVAVAIGCGDWLIWSSRHAGISWALTFLWSQQIVATALGLFGFARSTCMLRSTAADRAGELVGAVDAPLIVVVPTIGRWANLAALRRVVSSFTRYLTPYFPQLRVDIVADEGCEAEDALAQLESDQVRVIMVPEAYSTPAATAHKARALQFAQELRREDDEGQDGIWLLHMDDDTGVGADTARELADLIARHGEDMDLAQGVLTFPRQLAVSRLAWFADAVRPADDMTRFAALTGSGTPLGGLHGELLLIRASIEDEIGWDFGPHAISEDAQFALKFASLHPGRSKWFPGRSYGASPATVTDFIRQRRRWSNGLLEVLHDGSVPLRKRLLLSYFAFSLLISPIQNLAVVYAVAVLLGTVNTSPVAHVVILIWALNFAYLIFTYIEGLHVNVLASGYEKPKWLWTVFVILLVIPVSFLEAAAAALGALRFLRRSTKFDVIAKPI